VVAAVAGGLLTVDEACARYSLSLEEFAAHPALPPGLRAPAALLSERLVPEPIQHSTVPLAGTRLAVRAS
jgi:hypothetical protein